MRDDIHENQKVSFWVNGILTLLVIVMMIIYYLIGAKLLAYYSIFVTVVYLVNFILIKKLKLRAFIWAMYTMLTLYMFICTIFLGYNYGFSLYSMSTIPLIYVVKYISLQLKMKDPHPRFWTIVITISCLSSSAFAVYHGPIYNITGIPQIIFLVINIASVCFFISVFSARTIKIIVFSETKLNEQANFDALTGLANRYYIRNNLENLMLTFSPGEKVWLAILDIDNFKSINDTYGHNCGDEVLKTLSATMKDVCKNCAVSRWGGEEFLICCRDSVVSNQILETLRATVERLTVISEGNEIKFTITTGVSFFKPEQTIDALISEADNKLYVGKNSGKNKVVY